MTEHSKEHTCERVKVNKWNGAKVKIALDDALRDVMVDRGYVEDFTATDVKLFVTTLAVAIAGYGLYFRCAWRESVSPSPDSSPPCGAALSAEILKSIVSSVHNKTFTRWGPHDADALLLTSPSGIGNLPSVCMHASP